MMKKYINSILKWSVCLLIVVAGCKQDFISGVNTAEQGKIYFPDADTSGILIPVLKNNYYTLDTVENTLNVSIPVYRGGFDPTTPFTVMVAADNEGIADLITSGKLPDNTVALAPDDYTLAPKDTLSLGEGAVAMGTIVPRIKVGALEKYSGKVVALGLTLSGASKYSVNEEMNKVIFYLPVDSVVGKIYFEASKQQNESVISLLSNYTFDTTANTITCPVKINRGGFADLNNFTVEVSTDDNIVTALRNAGSLPPNTVALSSADYSLDNTVQMSLSNGIMQGIILPKINVASLEQYSGKKAALGLTLTSASKFGIDMEKNKVVVYFDVDSLLNDIIPPSNLIDNDKWIPLNISNSDAVTCTVNGDGSLFYSGGTGGYEQAAVYQSVKVRAGTNYKIDMHVKGSGMTNCWFEVWIGKKPQQGSDYGAGLGTQVLGLNTWSGCGSGAFDGSLAQIGCTGAGNPISFPTSDSVYIVIKSGGNNLGTTGVTVTGIDFRRVR